MVGAGAWLTYRVRRGQETRGGSGSGGGGGGGGADDGGGRGRQPSRQLLRERDLISIGSPTESPFHTIDHSPCILINTGVEYWGTSVIRPEMPRSVNVFKSGDQTDIM